MELHQLQEQFGPVVTNTPRPGDSREQLEARANRGKPAATPPNPKQLYGDKKPPLHIIPLAGLIHMSLALLDGKLKYGFENWNEFPVEKMTYIGAALRHLELYKYGETHTRDTGVHNLGAVMACCAILLDAELNGNLIDNAKHSKATCDLMHHAEAIVTLLNEAQAKREAEKA